MAIHIYTPVPVHCPCGSSWLHLALRPGCREKSKTNLGIQRRNKRNRLPPLPPKPRKSRAGKNCKRSSTSAPTHHGWLAAFRYLFGRFLIADDGGRRWGCFGRRGGCFRALRRHRALQLPSMAALWEAWEEEAVASPLAVSCEVTARISDPREWQPWLVIRKAPMTLPAFRSTNFCGSSALPPVPLAAGIPLPCHPGFVLNRAAD